MQWVPTASNGNRLNKAFLNFEREIGGAIAAAKATGLKEATIVTYCELEDIVDPSGITIHLVPVADWIVAVA